jgi:hypothetical protein
MLASIKMNRENLPHISIIKGSKIVPWVKTFHVTIII